MKGIGPPPGENTTNNESQELDFALIPELEDAYFEEGEQQMTQEEIDDAYSECIEDQHRQDEEMDEVMISNPRAKYGPSPGNQRTGRTHHPGRGWASSRTGSKVYWN